MDPDWASVRPGMSSAARMRRKKVLVWFMALTRWSMESDEPLKVTADGGIVVGADGAQWLLEGADQSRYHFVDRWFHQDDPSFERACLCLLVWSELDIAEDLDGYGATLPTEQECSQ